MKNWFFPLLLIGIGCSTPRVGHRQTVEGEPMLIGDITQAELVREFPVFQERLDAAIVLDSSVQKIRAVTTPTEIVVILGTWCGDSKRTLPPFLKLLHLAANPNIRVAMHGVDRTKKDGGGLTTRYGITRVPTMVVLQNGVEIGRFTERPKVSVESDIVAIFYP